MKSARCALTDVETDVSSVAMLYPHESFAQHALPADRPIHSRSNLPVHTQYFLMERDRSAAQVLLTSGLRHAERIFRDQGAVDFACTAIDSHGDCAAHH